MQEHLERSLARCEQLELSIQKSIRIEDLELELLRRDFKRAVKRKQKRRRAHLGRLAEVDQIHAEVRRQIDSPRGDP